MTQTLWGEIKPRRRRRRSRSRKPRTDAPYSITDGNDCAILGHTLNTFDLAGCTTCMDCGVRIFCPQCIRQHPNDPQAVAIRCPLHQDCEGSA